MHKTYRAVLAAVLAASTAYMVHQANAEQTYTGEGGLPLNPTAGGIAPGDIAAQFSHLRLGEEKGSRNGFNGGGGPSPSPTPVFNFDNQVGARLLPQQNPLETYRFNYTGFHLGGRVANNWELSGGVSRLRVSGDGEFNNLTKTGIALGVKYLINPDAAPGDIRYAIGVGYDRALLKNLRAYGVASKDFNIREGRAPIVGHLGLRWDRFDLEDVDGPESKKFSVFTGVEVPVTRDGQFAVIGELQSKNNEFRNAEIPFSLGVRYRQQGGGLVLTGGIQRQGLIGDEGWYARIGYSFR